MLRYIYGKSLTISLRLLFPALWIPNGATIQRGWGCQAGHETAREWLFPGFFEAFFGKKLLFGVSTKSKDMGAMQGGAAAAAGDDTQSDATGKTASPIVVSLWPAPLLPPPARRGYVFALTTACDPQDPDSVRECGGGRGHARVQTGEKISERSAGVDPLYHERQRGGWGGGKMKGCGRSSSTLGAGISQRETASVYMEIPQALLTVWGFSCCIGPTRS